MTNEQKMKLAKYAVESWELLGLGMDELYSHTQPLMDEKAYEWFGIEEICYKDSNELMLLCEGLVK